MPNPTRQNIHVNRPLTNISVAYMQKAESFVAGQVFPIVPVQKQSDRYFVYLKEDWFRDEAMKRVQGAESAGGGYEIDNTPTYFCETWAYHKDVTAADRANSDKPLTPDRDATQFISQKLLVRKEVEWMSRFFATSLWTTEYTGVTATPTGTQRLHWNDASSTPVEDVADAQIAIQAVTGYKPNVLTLGPYVYKDLRNHGDIIDRIKYSGMIPAMANQNSMAALFDVDKVIVAEGVTNSAAKGATEDTDFIAGKHALLSYSPNSPGLKQPTAGYTFSWTGLLGAGAFGNRMNTIDMPWLGLGTRRIEGEMSFDFKLVAADLGAFFNGIVA